MWRTAGGCLALMAAYLLCSAAGLPQGAGEVAALVEVSAGMQGSPGPEAGESFRMAVKETESSAWGKYGQMMMQQHVNRAKEEKLKMDHGATRDRLQHVDAKVEKREGDLLDDDKLQKDIDTLQENIINQADSIQDHSTAVQDKARADEKRAAELLQPGAIKELTDDAALAEGMKAMDEAQQRSSSTVLDNAITAGNASKVDFLAAVAQTAASQQRKYAKISAKEEGELGKMAIEAQGKLKDAIAKESKSLKASIEKRYEDLVKLKSMAKRGKLKLKLADKALSAAKQSGDKRQQLAEKVFEAQSLQKQVTPSTTETAAKKVAQKASVDVEKATENLEKAEDSDSAEEDDEGGEDKDHNSLAVHKARMALLKAKTKLVKANGIEHAMQMKAEGLQAEKAAYDQRIKSIQQAKSNATASAAAAQKVYDVEARQVEKLQQQIRRARKRLNQLKIFSREITPDATEPQSTEPVGTEAEELAKAQAAIDSARKAAKAVKRKSREKVHEALEKETTKNLILKAQLKKLKSEMKEENVVVKAQDQAIKGEDIDEGTEVAKAKLEAKGAQDMMEEAKQEQTQIVDKEAAAAATIVKQMKVEVRKEIADVRSRERDREEGAKKMLAKASGILLESKAMVGEYNTLNDDTKKELIQLEDPKFLATMSFTDLKKMAAKQTYDMNQQFARMRKKRKREVAGLDKPSNTLGSMVKQHQGDLKRGNIPDVPNSTVLDAPNSTVSDAPAQPTKEGTQSQGSAAEEATVSTPVEPNATSTKAQEVPGTPPSSSTGTSAESVATTAKQAEVAGDKLKALKEKLAVQEKLASEAERIDERDKRLTAEAVAVARVKDLKSLIRTAEQENDDAKVKNDTVAMTSSNSSFSSLVSGLLGEGHVH